MNLILPFFVEFYFNTFHILKKKYQIIKTLYNYRGGGYNTNRFDRISAYCIVKNCCGNSFLSIVITNFVNLDR